MMTFNRKHSKAQIAALLAKANELAAQGKAQNEIAAALGISVMTLHRWRKVASENKQSAAVKSEETDQGQRISELQLENLRLRQAITDLLLEKMDLEERLRADQKTKS